MALELAMSSLQTGNCANWILIDESGQESEANTTGWASAYGGDHNIVIDDASVSAATLTVTPITGDGDPVVFDLMTESVWQALTPYTSSQPFDADTEVTGLRFTLTEDLLGYAVYDGAYRIDYTVSDGGATSASAFNVFVYGTVESEMMKLVARIRERYSCHEHVNDYLVRMAAIQGMYQGLLYSARLNRTSEFETILESLQEACTLLNTLIS